MRKIYSADELIKNKPETLDILQITENTKVKPEGYSDGYYKGVHDYKITYDKKFARLTFTNMIGDTVHSFTALCSNNNCEEDKFVINKTDEGNYIIEVINGKEKEDM